MMDAVVTVLGTATVWFIVLSVMFIFGAVGVVIAGELAGYVRGDLLAPAPFPDVAFGMAVVGMACLALGLVSFGMLILVGVLP